MKIELTNLVKAKYVMASSIKRNDILLVINLTSNCYLRIGGWYDMLSQTREILSIHKDSVVKFNED